MATAPIAPFSGGEKARLALALIIWQKPNLLLLDEPTNHLDLETRHALTMALAQFEGTLIVVSHDRHLLRATTDRFMLVAHHELQPFDGDLDDYRDWLLQHAAAQRAATKGERSAKAEKDKTRAAAPVAIAASAPVPAAVDSENDLAKRKEQKREQADARQKAAQLRKPLQSRLTQLEKQMATLEAEKATLDAVIADPASYEAEQKNRLTATLTRQGEVVSLLAETEAAWLLAQEELEQLG